MQLQLQLAENHLKWSAAPVPLRLPVQRLALEQRRQGTTATAGAALEVGLTMLDHFIRVEFSGLPETRDMLLVRLGTPGELVLIIDGVDEAPGLQREVLMLLRQLLNSGHRFVVTSRPEGMAGENAKELLNCAECCVLNLDPLTEAQQLQAMNSQLEGEQKDFFEHLFNYIRSMDDNDSAYATTCPDRQLESISFAQSFIESHFTSRVDYETSYRSAPRQLDSAGNPIAELDELFRVAGTAKAVCDAVLTKLVNSLGIERFDMDPSDPVKSKLAAIAAGAGLLVVPLKEQERTAEKIRQKYKGDTSRVLDVVRCIPPFPSPPSFPPPPPPPVQHPLSF